MLVIILSAYYIIGSCARVSSRIWLCVAVTVLGSMAVSMHLSLRVHAQTAQRPGGARFGQVATADSVATVHVDVTPEHVLNTIYPDTATGAWMDDLSKAQVDNLSKPETIQGIKNLGWGSITMRNNSELRLAAWHWNENGTWSDPATKSGYLRGSADLGEPIHYGYSYSLPHRDFMTSGDAPLVAGFQSYWKSNPYLTSHFTGESDALHPQWVVIDMGIARAVNAIHIQWVNPYAVIYVVQYWIGDNNAMDWDMGPNGVWKAFPSGTVTERQGRRCASEAFGCADHRPLRPRLDVEILRNLRHTRGAGHSELRRLRASDAVRRDDRCRRDLLDRLSGERRGTGAWGAATPDAAMEPAKPFPVRRQIRPGPSVASSIDPWHAGR